MSNAPGTRTSGAALFAVVLAATTAACGGSAGGTSALPTIFTPDPTASASPLTWPSDTQVRAYLKAHPVPAVHGMIAGIRSFSAFTPSKDIHCASGGRGSAVIVGSPDDCLAWQVTIVTASGSLTITCGNLNLGIPCPSAAYPDRGPDPLPDTGDYIYAPAGGQVTASHDIRIIQRNAMS